MAYDPDAPLRGAIVAMTRDNVIGLHGDMPWHHSADLKRFKQRTLDKTIVMGRLTWESIGSKPLPGRRNVVVTSRQLDGVECYSDLQVALDECASEDTWVIGGGQIYQAAFHWLTLLDVTYVPETIDHPDAVRFPAIDTDTWHESSRNPLGDGELVNVVYHRG